jgi:hypothetical protein
VTTMSYRACFGARPAVITITVTIGIPIAINMAIPVALPSTFILFI